MLPIPDSMESIMTPENRLPLEYIPRQWGVLVLSDTNGVNYEILTGHALHLEWQSTRLVHFSPSSFRIPPDLIQVQCPDGTILCIKILSYGREASTTRQTDSVAAEPGPDNKPAARPTKPKMRISLKKQHA
jgi:hypothetical protein